MKAAVRPGSWCIARWSALVIVCACSTDPGPSVGRLQVSVLISGEARTLEGLRVTVNNRATHHVGPGGRVELRLEEGEHTLVLSGAPSSCSVLDGAVRTVMVGPGETLDVAFTIECRAVSGALQLRVVSTGPDVDMDPSGYQVTVDGDAAHDLESNGSIHLNLSAGSHQLALGGLADNCEVEGEAVRDVVVVGGARQDEVFRVTCREVAPAGPGREIAFTRGDDFSPGGSALLIMNSDGTRVRVLPPPNPGGGPGVFPSWSPDGSRLVVADQSSGSGALLYSVAADGSDPIRITPPLTNFGNHAFWSPAGDRLASVVYRWDEFGGSALGIDLALISLDGAALEYKALLFDSTASFNTHGERLAWAPDGSLLVLAISNPFEAPSDLYTFRPDGSDLRPLTETPEYESEPVFSPDGSTLAFTSSAGEGSTPQVYVMNADATDRVQLTTLGGWSPTWAPDGSRLAFVSARDGNAEIYVMAADGSGQIRVTNHPDPDVDPAWRP